MDAQLAREQAIIRGIDLAQARREANLHGYSVTEHYSVRNSRLNNAAEVVIEAVFSRNAGKTYKVVSESGSSLLRTRVLDKLLKEEADMSHGPAWRQSRVISDNYDFKLIGDEVMGGRPCHVLELIPRAKNPHVLKGKVWVDAKDYLLVRIEGRTSSSPSFLAGRPLIVREYQQIEGFAFPQRSHATASGFLLGTTELTIGYSDYKLTGA